MAKCLSALFSGGFCCGDCATERLKICNSRLRKKDTELECHRSWIAQDLRSVAQIMVWAQQNDPSVFNCFTEKEMLRHYVRHMRQHGSDTRFICTVLDALNTLLTGIGNKTDIGFIFNGEHVNHIILHKFDFMDAEVVVRYITLLQTLSDKLNVYSISNFFTKYVHEIPLYAEAIRFFNHSKSVVRIAVRTITLNIYKAQNDKSLHFILTHPTAAQYFSNTVWFIKHHVQELDACVRDDADRQPQNRLSDLVAEHLDQLRYLNDVLCLNITALNQVITDHVLHKLLIPLCNCLLSPEDKPDLVPMPGCSGEGDGGSSTGVVSKSMALFALSQVFINISHAPLICDVARIILETASINDDEEKKEAENIAPGQPKPMLGTLLERLDCNMEDYNKLLKFTLYYAMANNKGVTPNLVSRILQSKMPAIEAAVTGSASRTRNVQCAFDNALVDRILHVMKQHCPPQRRARLATFELCMKVLSQLAIYDYHTSSESTNSSSASLPSPSFLDTSKLERAIEEWHADDFRDLANMVESSSDSDIDDS